MAYHRPIAYIKRDLEMKQKEQIRLNKEVDSLEREYNEALMKEDLRADRIGEIFAFKKEQSMRLDREVQKLQKELKDERRRLSELER